MNRKTSFVMPLAGGVVIVCIVLFCPPLQADSQQAVGQSPLSYSAPSMKTAREENTKLQNALTHCATPQQCLASVTLIGGGNKAVSIQDLDTAPGTIIPLTVEPSVIPQAPRPSPLLIDQPSNVKEGSSTPSINAALPNSGDASLASPALTQLLQAYKEAGNLVTVAVPKTLVGLIQRPSGTVITSATNQSVDPSGIANSAHGSLVATGLPPASSLVNYSKVVSLSGIALLLAVTGLP